MTACAGNGQQETPWIFVSPPPHPGSPVGCIVLPSLLFFFKFFIVVFIILILGYLFVFKLRLRWFTTLSKFHVCNIIF